MILIGDLRKEISLEIQRSIVKTLDIYKHKESYYLLVWAGIDIETGIIRSKLILLDKKPPKMLGTLLAYVDNRKGLFEWVWKLPLDMPIFDPSDEIVESVFNSAIGMPIINS